MISEFHIAELSPGQVGGFSPRGGARELWRCKDHEVILAGPSETGKTYGSLQKLDALMWKYPGCQAGMIRKTLATVYTSVLQTYKNVIGWPETPIEFYGGEKPEWLDYPNGSRIFIGGMDNPGKTLSSERDFIYVNQAEELVLNDWETLTTRATGRAAHSPYAQVFGDCNPGPPTHWILKREGMRLLQSRHEDNPTLFDENGEITERGKTTLAILDRLTGVRKERLRKGRWVQAEGVVYEGFDVVKHLKDPAEWDRARARRTIAAVDWGYTGPGVIQVWDVDNDGRIWLVREVYRTKKTIDWWIEQARSLRSTFGVELFICDPAEPAFIQQFNNAGLTSIEAFNDIEIGIQFVAQRLQDAGDGRPRLFVMTNAVVDRDEELARQSLPTGSVEEFDVYIWPKGQDGKAVKEKPVDANNHGMDAMRYAVAYIDNVGRMNVRMIGEAVEVVY